MWFQPSRTEKQVTLRETAAEAYQKIAHFAGLLTHRMRVLPDFMIIGVQKGGTTALYRALRSHPQIRMAVRKEVHFFDNHFSRGLAWYRAFFPSRASIRSAALRSQKHIRVGEATPGYLFHPMAAERTKRTLPDARFIVLLRNPVDRAYSHYQHQMRRGRIRFSFEEALSMEEQFIQGEEEKIRESPAYWPRNLIVHSLKARGRYKEQFERWFQHFSREQFLILQSEEFFQYPEISFEKIGKFLQLEPFTTSSFPSPYLPRYPPMSSETRMQLASYFEPYNDALMKYLGVQYDW